MPALVTFADRLMADEALPRTIRVALGIDDEDHAAVTYGGRRPRAVRQALEVWIEDDEVIPAAGAPLGDLHEHRFLLHVGYRAMGPADRTGRNQLDAMRTHCRTLVAALDLKRLWVDVIGSEVLCSTAAVRDVDADPEEKNQIEGLVALSVLTRGAGELDGTQSPGG